ncbi:VOC family protein [Pseudomonas putida]|uniref:2-oxoadipate dioxygenase/decarboxylase HglS n=1 Tax=Pseudomonas putida TaxID=303 RepID=UPI002363EC63|nr:VOC family protein [Pseudomonas putida]MDD1964043.1 VOC family protein [Pseudomonas putida]
MSNFVSPDRIRADFSRAMSAMYQQEVPLYGDLMQLVADTNARTLQAQPSLAQTLTHTGEIERLDLERHGAIRVGTAEELATLGRLFAVMGMLPVGYYDLTPAGVPVHSTAFRAVEEAALRASPFRVFTSLLRLELIEDTQLRAFAERTLAARQIFTPRVIELIQQAEGEGGLTEAAASEFVTQALETFRWHGQATVSLADYQRLDGAHRLIADVVAFKGPHINHLTPRTLDIDKVQADMPSRGITPKAVIEGPPRRQCPILLRQTSFKALNEAIDFVGAQGVEQGSHSARFGEIEQRGVALTPEGRALYDSLLGQAREALGGFPSEANALRYSELLADVFKAFPDDYDTLRRERLAFFRYRAVEPAGAGDEASADVEALLASGRLACEPLVYEDFLPVSAAGIFQSNLGDNAQAQYAQVSNRDAFEQALGRETLDELQIYARTQQASLDNALKALVVPGHAAAI